MNNQKKNTVITVPPRLFPEIVEMLGPKGFVSRTPYSVELPCTSRTAIEAIRKRIEEDERGVPSPKPAKAATSTVRKKNAGGRGELYEGPNGEKKTLRGWSEQPLCPVGLKTLRSRIKAGWSVEKAMTTPLTQPKRIKGKTIRESAQDPQCVVTQGVLRSRLDAGWDLEAVMLNLSEKKLYEGPDGEIRTLQEWSEHPLCPVSMTTLYDRIREGWDPLKAITTPPAQYVKFGGKTVREIFQDPLCKVSEGMLRARLGAGWDMETAMSHPPRTAKTYEAFNKRLTISQWSQDSICVVGEKTLATRLRVRGWDIESALTITPEEGRRGYRKPRRDKPDGKIDRDTLLEAFGEVKSVEAWLETPYRMVGSRTVRERLAAGWDMESALQQPARPFSNPKARAVATPCPYCCSPNTHILRVVRLGSVTRRRRECVDCRNRFTTKTKE